MCYSAEIQADYRKLVRHYGATMSLKEFARLWLRENVHAKRPKTPKAMDDAFRAGGEGGLASIAAQLAAWDAEDMQNLEQELFKQARRLADADRVLASGRPTKKAATDQRIATTKIEQIKGRIADLQRTEPKARDCRIFPGYYAPVMISEGGQRVIKPMRYKCRPIGKPPIYDTKYPGTYNARRDNLQGFWREQFGYTHGLVVVGRFYENGGAGRQEPRGAVPAQRPRADVGGLPMVALDGPGRRAAGPAELRRDHRRARARGGLGGARPDDHQHQARAHRCLAQPRSGQPPGAAGHLRRQAASVLRASASCLSKTRSLVASTRDLRRRAPTRLMDLPKVGEGRGR